MIHHCFREFIAKPVLTLESAIQLGTYPSCQRRFLSVPPTLLRSYRCAVSRNERHYAVLTRSANAAAQLVLRTQAER